MLLEYLLSYVLCAWCCRAGVTPTAKSDCEKLSFTYNVTSMIKDVDPPPDLSAPGAVSAYQKVLIQKYATAVNVTRKGAYTLVGWYCKAPDHGKVAGHRLQVLAHGSTYTKEYWNRGAWGNLTIRNSWQYYAGLEGYSTLAIDRLCNGASSRPDPQLDCQLSTSIETFHALFVALRNGTASPKIPKSTELAFVGHSAGSITASNHVQAYPRDVDTVILTGWPSGPLAAVGAGEYNAAHNITAGPPPTFSPGYFPAAIGDPTRFPGLDQGYIISTNASFRSVFYSGKFNPSLPLLDYISRGTSPLGEASYTGVHEFSEFKGKVMIVTGDLDGAAWADGDVIERSKKRFPSAKEYRWIRAKDSGHDVNFHRSAYQTFGKVFVQLAIWQLSG